MSTQAQTQEQIKEQMATKAKQAATVAAASGNMMKGAFLSTITGAKTTGERAAVFGSLAGLVAFFLPWITEGGTLSESGLWLALHTSNLFWLYPVSMVVCFGMAWFLLNADAKKRIVAARWLIVIGTLWLAPGLASICNVFSAMAGVGTYVATASGAAILLGGFLQITDCLKMLIPASADTV
jgi:hypothetical protein